MGTAILVVIGGAIGAPLRYLAGQYFKRVAGDAFPWGTFVVNMAGSALLGFLVGVAASTPVNALLGTGLCGALTTFSTFSNDTVGMLEKGSYAKAAANALGSLLLGLCMAALFYTIGHALI